MRPISSDSPHHQHIRALFDTYVELYTARDERLTTLFSDNFSGYTVGSGVLVTDRDIWVSKLRQDFAEVPERIRIEMRDISLQDLSEHVVAVTAFFNLHLPVADHILSHEITRLSLVFRCEGETWKIVHSGTSIPYHLVAEGEIYPTTTVQERNRVLEAVVAERTRELHEREEFYRLLTEDTHDVIWRADKDLYITYISPSDERFRGFKQEEVIGRHVFELFTDEGVAIVSEAWRKRQQSERDGKPLGFVHFEAPHRCKNGSVIWGEVYSSAMRDEQGNIIGFHGITRENTERKKMEQKIHQLAFYDNLTQLPNRRLLVDRLHQALVANKRRGTHGAVMFIDLDNFKPLNDTYGHYVGDLLLIAAAQRLKDCVREVDSVARFGGDEFVILLNELGTDREKSILDAAAIAEKVRMRLAEAYPLNAAREDEPENIIEYRCSASIGVFVFKGNETNSDNILKFADKAMYDAKDAGRNRVRFYTAE